jgi:hypothetical protein
LSERLAGNAHGAGRIGEHAVLDPLPPVQRVTFTFDGLSVEGREGEPIAAALLAGGYRVLRTMPRRGGARGGYCMVGRCTDCLVVVDGVTNVFACMTPVAARIEVRAQHGLDAGDAIDVGRTSR